MKKNLAIIFGGCSSEYPVSLKSAYSILTNIDSSKYDVIPVGITRDGQWFHFYGDYQEILDDTWHQNLLQLKRIVPFTGLAKLQIKAFAFSGLTRYFLFFMEKMGKTAVCRDLRN